jgi:hypothetical protein
MHEYEIHEVDTGIRTGYVFANSIEKAYEIAHDYQGDGIGVYDRETEWFYYGE